MTLQVLPPELLEPQDKIENKEAPVRKITRFSAGGVISPKTFGNSPQAIEQEQATSDQPKAEIMDQEQAESN